jgi:hypothetical protein
VRPVLVLTCAAVLCAPIPANAGEVFLPAEAARVSGPVKIEISAGADRTDALFGPAWGFGNECGASRW